MRSHGEQGRTRRGKGSLLGGDYQGGPQRLRRNQHVALGSLAGVRNLSSTKLVVQRAGWHRVYGRASEVRWERGLFRTSCECQTVENRRWRRIPRADKEEGSLPEKVCLSSHRLAGVGAATNSPGASIPDRRLPSANHSLSRFLEAQLSEALRPSDAGLLLD